MTQQEILTILEPEQLTSSLKVPLERRKLGLGTVALFWLLRGYVFAAVLIVVATFVKGLAH